MRPSLLHKHLLGWASSLALAPVRPPKTPPPGKAKKQTDVGMTFSHVLRKFTHTQTHTHTHSPRKAGQPLQILSH